MTTVLGRLLTAAVLLALPACGVAPEGQPQPLPTTSPAAQTAACSSTLPHCPDPGPGT